jgi:hypothetical protein
MQLLHRLHREHCVPDSPVVRVRNLLPSSWRCLQGHYLALGLHAAIFLLLIYDYICFFISILIFLQIFLGEGLDAWFASVLLLMDFANKRRSLACGLRLWSLSSVLRLYSVGDRMINEYGLFVGIRIDMRN